jgi:hypothetical protein
MIKILIFLNLFLASGMVHVHAENSLGPYHDYFNELSGIMGDFREIPKSPEDYKILGDYKNWEWIGSHGVGEGKNMISFYEVEAPKGFPHPLYVEIITQDSGWVLSAETRILKARMFVLLDGTIARFYLDDISSKKHFLEL